MTSIKDKVAKMIALAQGELVRHCHAVEAGILGEDNQFHSRSKKLKSLAKSRLATKK